MRDQDVTVDTDSTETSTSDSDAVTDTKQSKRDASPMSGESFGFLSRLSSNPITSQNLSMSSPKLEA
jgi:hypothetical protein